jgi:myo-inositol 2-dehydrogenase / D-chiro-inositol 1-dehydrogenase
MSAPLGVGILGAGPVTQAIHLPTLATLYDHFRIVHIMDINSAVAEDVASRSGARSTTDTQVLLDDPAVDVVAICSPHQFHADQVEAAAMAGKRAILCEKPLATTVEEAQRIADVSASSGIPVVVGAMHVHDPAVAAASRAWGDLSEDASLVRVVVYLPSNDELVDLATELAVAPVPAPGPAPGAALSGPALRAAGVRGGILGLATHNLPLVRRFAPTVDEVLSAGYLNPWGYELTFRSGGTAVQLIAVLPGQWRPDWSMQVFGSRAELHVQFPPSYVLAGSATATLSTSKSQTAWRYPLNGYQQEWLHLSDVVNGRAELAPLVQTAVDDLLYALRLADGADELILEER